MCRTIRTFRAWHIPRRAQRSPHQDWPHKTSIAFSLRRNVPGALFKSLAVFALRDLDLHKIESRPMVGSPGQYLFYLDVEGNTALSPGQRAMDHLKEIASEFCILGSYPIGTYAGRQ